VGVPGLQIVQRREIAGHDLDRHLARDFPSRVATHAIRDYENPAKRVGVSVKGVFVSLSDPAYVCAGRYGEMHLQRAH